MISFQSQKTRFSLYYLEESEVYLQDFSAKFRYNNEERSERGKIHICSRSLLFEPEKQELSIQKFFYKFMTISLKGTISFKVKRIIEISTQGPPSPYVYIEDLDQEMSIEPLFENVNQVYAFIEKLHAINKKSHDIEADIQNLDPERAQKVRFNMSFVESVSEKPLLKEMFVRKVMPLIQTNGILYITNKMLYFQPVYKVTAKPCKKYALDKIRQVYKRRFELMDIGLEVILEKKAHYFAFQSQEQMEEVYRALTAKVAFDLDQGLEKITYLWQSGQMSNFDYLMKLNQAGNRSFSDLTQYPVFPLLIIDMQSPTIDLNDVSIYRDLKKPIGALNAKRLLEFRKRYQDMPNPKFLYGTHYSTPGYVIGYLVRCKPQYMLKLQSGKFDKPDRLFKSISGDLKNILNNATALKEMIPEFYGDNPAFLVNKLGLDLGVRQNGKKVSDVKLPKWASSASEYLRINRQALESEHVSNNLHHWIDLIFGSKQKGPSSIEADNVFHHLTYEGTISLNTLADPVERQAFRCQINEFGQCPKQLFKIPHPPKYALKAPIIKTVEQVKQMEPEIDQNLIWENLNKQYPTQVLKVHKSNITDMCVLQNKQQLITIASDGFLKVIDIKENTILKQFKIDDFCLSVITAIKQDEIFAIGSWGSQVHLFNITYGSKVQVIQRFNNAVSSLVFLKNKKILITGSWDCSLKRFECSDTQIFQDTEEIIDDWEAQITNIAATDDEELIAVGDVDGKVSLINTDSWDRVQNYEIQGEKIVKLLFFKNSILVAGDSQMRLFNQGTQLLEFKIEKQNGIISDVLIDREKYLITTTKKGNISVFSMLLEQKIGFMFTDFVQQPDLIVVQDNQFTKIALKDKVIILASGNGSVQLLQY